jgi:hypothetical protein
MPGVVTAHAAQRTQPRLKLANALWEVTSPRTILAASVPGATERLRRLVEQYRTLLASLGLLKSLETVLRSQSVSPRFMLIHSSFEFLLAQLDKDPERRREDHDYLVERVKLTCLAPLLASGVPFTMTLRKRFLLKPVPIPHTNLILDLRPFTEDELVVAASSDAGRFLGASSFPDFAWDEAAALLRFSVEPAPFLLRNPADYFVYSTQHITDSEGSLAEDSPSYEVEYRGARFEEIAELIERAKPLIESYDPRLLSEVWFFVRSVALDTCREGEGKVFYSSLRWQPGLVQMTPYLLGKREGMKLEKRGDPLLGMLVAAQIIHEGLHQKHFYLNSCEDPRIIDAGPRGFTRPEFAEVPITCTWGERRGLNDFFNLAVSLGFEIRFLEYLARTQNLHARERDFFERRLRRKRGYLLPLLVQAELLRRCFTPEGQLVLGELFRFFGYRTT